MKADALWKEFEDRKAQDSKRIEEYNRMLAPYFGEDALNGQRDIIANNADGRAALRVNPETGGRDVKRDVLNLIPQIVDSIVAVRGINPTHSVLPQGAEEQDRQLQVKRTRGLREQHTHSGMIIQGAQLAFYLASMGDGCFVLNPRVKADVDAEKEKIGASDPFRPIGVYVSVINPKHAYPKFVPGDPNNALEDLFCYEMVGSAAVKEQYGISVSANEVPVVQYYSRTEKRILCDGRDVHEPITHNLGFCPAVWCYNKANDGRPAQSEIRMAIAMNEQLGLVYDIWLDALIWAVHPIIHAHDREYIETPSGQPEVGPGSTVSTTQSGKVELLSPQGHPEVAERMMETLVDALHQVTGVSPIQTQGIIDRSNVSARSVSQQQSPMEGRLMLSNLLLSQCYEQLNARILLMLSNVKLFGKDAEFPMYGTDQQGIYNETFTPEDIGGWIRTKTKWDATLGTSKHELMAMILQIYKESQITGQPYRFPFRLLLEAAGYDDAQALMDEALSESKAAQAQMPPQGGPPGQGAPPDAGAGGPPAAMQDASAIQQGGLAAVGPPGGDQGAPPPGGAPAQPPPPETMPTFPSNAAPPTGPKGSPASVPDIPSMVEQATAGLKLKGYVVSATGGPHNSIVITVSDQADIPAVRAAVQAIAQGMDVIVKPAKPAQLGASPNGRAQ